MLYVYSQSAFCSLGRRTQGVANHHEQDKMRSRVGRTAGGGGEGDGVIMITSLITSTTRFCSLSTEYKRYCTDSKGKCIIGYLFLYEESRSVQKKSSFVLRTMQQYDSVL